jgi:hypothetical protein
MATDSDTAGKMNDWLRAKGYICGRKFASIGDLVRGVEADVKEPKETSDELQRRVKRIVKTAGYGFKSQNDGDQVSASEPKCG